MVGWSGGESACGRSQGGSRRKPSVGNMVNNGKNIREKLKIIKLENDRGEVGVVPRITVVPNRRILHRKVSTQRACCERR